MKKKTLRNQGRGNYRKQHPPLGLGKQKKDVTILTTLLLRGESPSSQTQIYQDGCLWCFSEGEIIKGFYKG